MLRRPVCREPTTDTVVESRSDLSQMWICRFFCIRCTPLAIRCTFLTSSRDYRHSRFPRCKKHDRFDDDDDDDDDRRSSQVRADELRRSSALPINLSEQTLAGNNWVILEFNHRVRVYYSMSELIQPIVLYKMVYIYLHRTILAHTP